ncbi:hypothetical protein V5799_010273 [Amblyomma americanum]|uniref:Uncharacterized protein n=1 Tax=Amblyomma americanum TaxID=6943 RepID=A0AAQ4F9J8_AMBAM
MRTCEQRHSSSACRVILLSGGFGFSISVPSEEDVAIHNGSGEQCIPDVQAEDIEVHESTKLPFPGDQETATHSADRIATPEPLASDLEHASTHQALLNRISQLERLHEESQRKLGAAKRRYLKSEEEKERLKSKFKHIFSDDQMRLQSAEKPWFPVPVRAHTPTPFGEFQVSAWASSRHDRASQNED